MDGGPTPTSDPAGSAPGDGEARPIPALAALVPALALVGLLSLFILGLPRWYPGFEGSGHLPLLMAAAVAGITARAYGHRWPSIEAGIRNGIEMALGAILILLSIGILIGTWIAGGVVPALIDWGLGLLSPSYFLPTACAVCSVVSLVSGSSWSTAGTVGLAMIGIGGALEVDPAMTAGAVVSGAYFGDKLSPMSDTTNLAPAMAGTDLFTHIRHQMYTTAPAWVLAMLGYTWLSIGSGGGGDPAAIASIQHTIREAFDPGLWHMIPPVVVLVLVLRRQPALPTLLLGGLLGALLALTVGGMPASAVVQSAMSGYVSATGDPSVDELLSRGGLTSMSGTVLLILCAMSFGGIMERTGMLQTLAAQLLKAARSTGSLVATTVLTAAGINVVAADQYIAIVVPGRMFATAFADAGLAPKNLSRAIEDGGTITSPLVPWNTCGAFMAGTLGVATGAYLPFAFLNLLNPLISIVYGFTGWFIAPLPRPSDAPRAEPVP